MKSKEQKRREAAERTEAWNKLTPKEQLTHLDMLGVKAEKQRAKIAKRIDAET